MTHKNDLAAYAECVAALPERQRGYPPEVLWQAFLMACETEQDNAHDTEITARDYYPHCLDLMRGK